VNAQGYQVVKTYCGHGIGELFHSAPNIPHYARNKAVGICHPGMIFTIEPMINMGDWQDCTWRDDWTSVTKDGKRSAQFEHTLLVTETGCEILTARTENSVPLFWEVEGYVPIPEETPISLEEAERIAQEQREQRAKERAEATAALNADAGEKKKKKKKRRR